MSRNGYLICGISLAFGLNFACFAFRWNDFCNLIFLLLAIPFLISMIGSVVYGWTQWPNRRLAALVPLIVVLFSVFVVPRLAINLRDFYFRSRMGELNGYVEKIVNDRTSVEVPGFLHAATWHEDSQGRVYVYFPWGGGFPVKHQVLVYLKDDATLQDSALSFRALDKIQDHWYLVQD